MPSDLPTLLHAATGLTWEWLSGPWWYVSSSGRWYLSEREDGAWSLTDRGATREYPWLTMRDDEPVSDFHQRVATEVAMAIREVTCAN